MRFLLDGLEVFFPYDYVYKEQYQYMLELKRSLDAKGDAILEMPTGTGKTVSLLALITSYQFAHPEAGKLIYCTRTVPEMTKAVDELKRVIEYRTAELSKGGAKAPDMLAVCLSSRRNMCVHPDVIDESDREKVDAACRSMTASWVRQRAKDGVAGARLCDFFERYDSEGADAGLTGIYNLDDIKALGTEKGWCPYFLTRHVISYANVVVYNYQYMLDPKIAALVSRELEDKSIVVFDEAHNIDNVCIEALSVSLDRRTIDGAARNLGTLGTEVKRMKQEDAARLQDEYARMVHVSGVGGGRGGGLWVDGVRLRSAVTLGRG
jgi:DNA excision repair protein ERCC-2